MLAAMRRLPATQARQARQAPAAAAPVTPLGRRRRAASGVAARAWQQVTEEASGRPYYWNTTTNETSWDAPPSETSPAAATATPADISAAATTAAAATTTAPPAAVDFEVLLQELVAAYRADPGTGQVFAEAARARRPLGVFKDDFIFDFLSARIDAVKKSGDDGSELEFIRARLVNPLLRQPAPFE